MRKPVATANLEVLTLSMASRGHSILVGVDGSEAARGAVRWAVGVLREGDTLCLVTASTCSPAGSTNIP